MLEWDPRRLQNWTISAPAIWGVTVSVLSILRQTSIFHGLSEDQLNLIASISYHIERNTGDIVFESGSASDELYVIEDGEVDIVADAGDSSRKFRSDTVTLTTLRRGQSFGEMALISQNVRSAAARCAQHDTNLIIIPRPALSQLCEQHPMLGYMLMRNLAADLASKIRSADIRLQEQLSWTAIK